MEFIIGILMLFGIATVGTEVEAETSANLKTEPTAIESASVVPPVPKAADANQQTCFAHDAHSTYRDLTIQYGSQQRITAPCLQSCNRDCSDE